MASIRSKEQYKELKGQLKKGKWTIKEELYKQNIMLIEKNGYNYALYMFFGEGQSKYWLADEKNFNGEDPMWFSEDSHMVSPVYKLEAYMNSIQNGWKECYPVVILMDGSVIINGTDMAKVWNEMGINVATIDRIKSLLAMNLDLELNTLVTDISPEKKAKSEENKTETNDFDRLLQEFIDDELNEANI